MGGRGSGQSEAAVREKPACHEEDKMYQLPTTPGKLIHYSWLIQKDEVKIKIEKMFSNLMVIRKIFTMYEA
ncbi:hypothetical protein STEG23_035843 [Scotinomys teguina]